MRLNCISRPLHFLYILANYVDSMFIHCFYDPLNFVSKYFHNTLIEFVENLPQPRQLREVQAP